MIKLPELLAPAGSPDALKEAISAGADAVYLSGKKFGARQFADNFSVFEIESAIQYAHLRGVKVYVTVNTLIKERELSSAAEYVFKLYSMGVDGVLVQDLGLSHIIKEIFPDMDLHGSTQMTIHNNDSLEWLEENGFSRVVLSRELSMDEVNSMTKNSRLELEIFLHGALCYSYSGQCLLSSFIGGRSGNRGMCAQPCRKPYTIITSNLDEYGRPIKIQALPLKEKYILSPKDLCLYPHLRELVNSKISSLKIEGRMRSPEYVKTAVSIYRQALDKIGSGTNHLNNDYDMEVLKLGFNRGFTSGYLFKSMREKLMGRDKPGHRGLFIGNLKKYNPKKREGVIHLKSIIKPGKGDGLFFVPSNNEAPIGMDIEKPPFIKGKDMFLSLKKPVTVPSRVFLTRKKDLSLLYKNHQPIDLPNLAVDLFFKLDANNYPHLKGQIQTHGGKVVISEVVGKTSMEPAKTRPLSNKNIQKQLLKMGDKPFKGKISDIEYDETLFLPIKELNQLRRELIEDLEKKVIESYTPSLKKIDSAQLKLNELKKGLHYHGQKQNGPFKNASKSSQSSINLSVYVNDIPSLKSAIKTGFDRIYLDIPLLAPEKLLSKCSDPNSKYDFDFEYVNAILDEAIELCSQSNSHLVWKWPNITRNYLLDFLKKIKKDYPTGLDLMVGNIGAGNFIKKSFDETRLYGSYALNVWNHRTIATLSPLFSLITLSPELSWKEINNIIHYQKSNHLSSNSEIEILVQGNMESIISENCLISPDLISKTYFSEFSPEKSCLERFWGIKDERERVFPLKISSDCQSIILNSVETCLVNYVPAMMNNGIKNIAIDGRWRGERYVEKMGYFYEKAIQNSKNNKKVEKIKKDIKKISLGGITSYNFMKGIEKP
ncbi:DUF3656 domain-containing U32 family peptidase [Methanobacterium alcaliphilum]|uniref:DUF3656 domain-containing U32 family peptidase n=1 Tax=Methanobacterium alcaliphilum TaxID=392018 RepID=UPI00200A6BAD|nr:U32 family peptidase [Methanobacterium alcaliphilum]MCK9152301.1 DUF3656 domain-containing protein [Methanobacterium alcaliphilum]